MKIAVPRETAAAESRVAATPDTVKRLVAQGATVVIETAAGKTAMIPDADYQAFGAQIAPDRTATLKDADVVLTVRRPNADTLADMASGTLLIGSLDPFGHEAEIAAIAKQGVSAFSMEFMPRITRAQSMDVLSSQANLAGYQAVIEAATAYGRAMPMMMTAAGTVPAARVFIMGAGVAGLQAIATARRLGAVVTATDVRPAAKEQVESLGAKFIAVEDDEFKQAETSGGYAKEMSEDYRKKQAELVASHIAKQDIVITTALIPGRPAPKLVNSAMLSSMKPGSVVVDLAAERGGNVEGTVPGEVATVSDVTVIGYENMAGRIPASASALYAKNLFTFLETMIDKESKTLKPNWDDELLKATCLTRDGAVVHPAFAPKQPETPVMVAAGKENEGASA
ncbi:Re/Si-specific NAD(P)(+) transhydrogenase subunit alpha [Roseibium sp. CAU 1637]|uniref:NAD(P) transhydrogenase subunit alpha part 1 n=1 Tax=Roseibium limicola TaxID=2816037 RepID=A0A939ERE9_9HYPH|nr:Re/Si-specific NAD(P)(+) transhydrogenase subunit alpha [Roseibium limicola]MBO0346950.1 Re/Si-specific NAD(P)(+) transhydrogenase subunit alpha [Roseibium limicola]